MLSTNMPESFKMEKHHFWTNIYCIKLFLHHSQYLRLCFSNILLQGNLLQMLALLMEPYAVIQVFILLSAPNKFFVPGNFGLLWRNPWQPLAEPRLKNTTLRLRTAWFGNGILHICIKAAASSTQCRRSNRKVSSHMRWQNAYLSSLVLHLFSKMSILAQNLL